MLPQDPLYYDPETNQGAYDHGFYGGEGLSMTATRQIGAGSSKKKKKKDESFNLGVGCGKWANSHDLI